MMLPLLSLAAHAGIVQGAATHLDDVYAPRRVAVVIGVQDYADPKLQGLRYATKDAHDMAAVLEDPRYGAFDRVVLIDGQDATSAAAIDRAISVATADLQRNDTFLLYLSGHGTLTLDAHGSHLWFLPSDGLLDQPQRTGLAVSRIEDRVNSLPARRRVLILDTCHNGRAKSALNSPTSALLANMRGEPPAPRDLREVSESEAWLFAAQYHQPAMEDPNLQNGVYTHFLIDAITSQAAAADLDGDGLVDVAEAHDYARDHTIEYTGGIQVPRAEYRIVGREEIYLSGDTSLRTRAEKALISATDQLMASASLFIDGSPRGAGLVAVQPGRRHIELRDANGDPLVRRTMRLRAGTTLPVESLLERDPGRVALVAGPSLRLGQGREDFQPWAGELEAAWLDPFQLTRHWRPELHLRGSFAEGTIPDQGEWPVQTGEAGAGLSVGWRTGDLSMGPLAEVLTPWRVFDNETGNHRQITVTGAAGARALWAHRVGHAEVLVRYDVRYAPYFHEAAWTSLWHHGIAVGLTASR